MDYDSDPFFLGKGRQKEHGELYKKFLVGGAITILKNMKVNGQDDPIYEMENKPNV
jgi:hypothetical protein